jgi:ABC-type transporter Mla subunit MlaD
MFKREVGKPRSRAFLLAMGGIGVVIALVTFYIGYEAANSVPGRGYYNLHAKFRDAENLANHYEIRMGGVRVGQILNPRVTEDGLAEVDMRLSDQYKPLKSDTRVTVRLRSAVGVRYLEIIPGTKGTDLPDGATIPPNQTEPTVALDQVLDTFDSDTRGRVQDLVNAMGEGVTDRGTDINQELRSAPGFISHLGSLSAAINARTGAIQSFAHNADGATQAFDPVRNDIADGFDPEQRALTPFNDGRTDVQATLVAAAPALRTIRIDMPRIGRFVGAVGHFAHDVQPTLAVAPGALSATDDLLNNATKPLGDAGKTLQLLSDATDPVLGLLHKVEPALAPTKHALRDLLPTLDYAAPRACDLTSFAWGWADYTKWGDDVNSFIRFIITAVRPEQPGSASAELNAVSPLHSFVNSDPYATQTCVNGVGSQGFVQPTEAEAVQANEYGPNHMPGSLGR